MDEAYLVFEKLKEARGVSAYRVAKDCGIPQTTLSDWKNGRIRLSLKVAEKLADYFQVPVDAFIGRAVPQDLPAPSTGHTRWVPVLGRVAAGIPAEMVEDVLDYEEIESSVGDAFALMIRGSSMLPVLLPDDVVIVKREDDVESGAVAVVSVDGADATCKKIVKPEGGGVILQPLNPDYAPLFFSDEEIATLPVRILGRVVEVRRRL